MGKERKFDSRIKDEKAEGEKTIESGVSDSKFQSKQQVVNPVAEGEGAKPGANGFIPKVSASKGSQLKQEKVSEVITGTGGVGAGEGVASPSRAGLRTLAYSGNEGTILGNPSGTPVVGTPSRSDTRPGQKLDAVAKAIDFIASEQAIQNFDGSKPLQDNPGEVQGFLGHPENNSARIQKIAEAVPGALLFARSCDEIARDEIAYSRGQMIREEGIEYQADVTKTYDVVTKDYKPYSNKRGNYIPKVMHISVDAKGDITNLTFDVDELNITADAETVNRSASAFIRSVNKDELNRQHMETVAGVETEKNWCPIVRAIAEPTATVGHLTDQEALVGAEQFMAYRFVNKAQAYQFNKAAKDGQTPYRSFKEALYGLTLHAQDSAKIPESRANFNAKDYLQGAPSLMIALYDSIAKYSKRGDLFVQPRSWKMHKQTADNNINPFKVDPDFARYVANRDTFSTIDRGYDPFLPVCITDNWRVSHSLNFNKLLNYSKAAVFVTKMGGKGVTLAGTAFNTIYDHKDGAVGRLALYKDGEAVEGTIYEALGRADSQNYGDPILMFATDKSGSDNYQETLEEALIMLDAIEHAGNNAQLHPVIILFKITGTPDDVYALVRYPGVANIGAAGSHLVQAFVDYDATSGHLLADMSVNFEYIRTDTLYQDNLTYKYQNRQNPYVVEVKNPLLYGILEWARNLGTKLARPSTSDQSTVRDEADDLGTVTYHIPIIHSTTNISLWDLIVCASVPFAQKIRTNSMYDVLNYEDNNGKYPFEQLVSISEANPLTCVNYTFKDMLQPLGVGQMKPAIALTWIMPEKFWRIDHTFAEGKMSAEKFVLPFYFSEEQFHFVDVAGDVHAIRKDDGYLVNYPSTRAGARLSFTDMFYSMTERDIRLCFDMMTDIPGGKSALNTYNLVGVYKYGLSNSGIPVAAFDENNKFDIAAYLKTPRELGLGMVAPCGYNRVSISKHINNGRAAYSDYASLSTLMSIGSSYWARAWRVLGGRYQDLHDPLSVVVTRGGNFAQDWAFAGDCIYASADNTTVEAYGTLDSAVDFAICLNFNDIMEVGNGVIGGEEGKSVFKPFTKGGVNHQDNLPNIITLQNALWPRLQVLPFALSPFDQTPEGRHIADEEVTVDMTADPYDFMTIFGFCGFKASDYREDANSRINEKDNLGWTYTIDPFVQASPILK